MLRIIDCITLEHDLALVLLAALICLLGCSVTVLVAGRTRDGHMRLWTLLAGFNLVTTVWATHFIAMLAWRLSLPITYDPWLTALSFLVGLVPILLGFALATREHSSRRSRCAGGALVGVGVIGLHYVGMAGVHLPGAISYDLDLLIASGVLSIGLGSMALVALFAPRFGHRVSGGLLLLLMTVSLHFTGVSAAELALGPVNYDVSSDITRPTLIVATGLAALLVLLIGALGALVDRRIAARFAAEAERFRTLADGAFEGLIVHHDRVIVDSNAAARELLGLDGSRVGSRIDHWPLGARDDAALDTQHIEEIVLEDAEGRSFPAEIGRRGIRLPDGRAGELIAIRDLSLRKAHEARIAHLAMHDPLTDLPNRRYFGQLLAKALSRASTLDGPPSLALLAMDLDDFKGVNDVHGHAAGDTLICTVARRIANALDEHQVVARLGGDEFILLDNAAPQPDRAIELAERLHSALAEPVALDDESVHTHASIGIAVHPSDGLSVDELMRHADTAMYRAKNDGKGISRCFETGMNEELKRRRLIETRLRHALQDDALDLHYQPQVDSKTRVPLGFEALLRWHDEELGQVSPVEFIPLAESLGLILPIGEFVLRRACQVAAGWPSSVRIAVNLSVAQFRQQGLIDTVQCALQESGLPGSRLEIEITESLLIDDRERALQLLSELEQLGIHVAMDDFGTGYSSLGYLQSFDFHKLKIDRAFVSSLEADPRNASIVRAVVSMGKSLHMRVVAEGVETEAQARMLADLDCDELQGYLIARPMLAAAVPDWLERHRPGEADDHPMAA